VIFLSASIILFVLWVITADVFLPRYRKARAGKEYHPVKQAIILAWTFWFVVVDIVYNIVFGGLIFWQSPIGYGWTLSQRLRHILTSGDYDVESWRWQLAWWLCRYLISPWDYNHCRIGLGGTK